jgi:hypothetical protein
VQLRAIHQHVGPTCTDFMDENAGNGSKALEGDVTWPTQRD